MWLIGMMGSGKTTVGERAAERLAVLFYDTDRVVAAKTGRTVADIWSEDGEAVFRGLEKEAISEAPVEALAAAGGGAVLDSDNRSAMARGGKIVWLKGRPETLAERLGDADERPLLRGPTPRIETLRRILQEREVAYATLATHSLDTDAHGVDEIVSQVVEIWRD